MQPRLKNKNKRSHSAFGAKSHNLDQRSQGGHGGSKEPEPKKVPWVIFQLNLTHKNVKNFQFQEN